MPTPALSLPSEIWADMLEEQGQDTSLLRAWLPIHTVDNYDGIIYYQDKAHSHVHDDTFGNYGDAGAAAASGNGRPYYTDMYSREIGHGGGNIAR